MKEHFKHTVPKEEVEFLCDDHYFTIIQTTSQQSRCLLTVPFCLSILKKQTKGKQHILTQVSIGSKGQYLIETAISDIQWENYLHTSHVKKHLHNYTEFMYVIEGTVQEHIDSKSKTYTEGYACLLNENMPHCEKIIGDCTVVYLCFAKSYSQELMTQHLIKKKAGALYDFAVNNAQSSGHFLKQYIEFSPLPDFRKNVYQIHKVLHSIIDELLKKQPGQQQMIYALTTRLFAYFLDYPGQFQIHHIILDTKSDCYTFHQIQEYIEHYSGRPSRQNLAKYFHYSGDHINRIIKKYSGKNFVDFVWDIHLQKAENLLKNTDISVSEIITTLGFENKSHFYDMFRRKHNITPLEYRAKFR